ncbi:MAG: hypothetical protein U0M60_08340, partial [Clostridia bacterium]|nr:hypothetical protein [Clostridia bacterium]
MNNLTPELIAKAKAASTVDELRAIAKANGIELTEEEAATYFAQLNANGAVSDEELNLVVGGSCPNNEEVTYEFGEIVCLKMPCTNCGCRYARYLKTDTTGGCFVGCVNCREHTWFRNT